MKPNNYRYVCYECGMKARNDKPLPAGVTTVSKRICDCCEEYGDAWPVRTFGYPWEAKKETWHST